MLDLRFLVRPMLAAPFIVGGLNVLRTPKTSARAAADVAEPIANAVGLDASSEALVKANAGAQVGAGAALALGFFPRVAALVLGASVVPSTIAAHRFWDEREPAKRGEQMLQFAKSAGLLGGLLAAALDTGGRPSVFWSGRRAAGRAAQNVAGTVGGAAQTVADTVSGAYHSLPVVS
jgi:putative oxidoreductase